MYPYQPEVTGETADAFKYKIRAVREFAWQSNLAKFDDNRAR
jgi:hypothetical protein